MSLKFSSLGGKTGKVVLLSGGGKIYTDIAARFCRSNEDLDNIVASDYNKNIVKNILANGHLAATEFDYFIFGVEGYSRVCEVQLVRKRLASYMISSGRVEKNGKRSFDIILPDSLQDPIDINIPITVGNKEHTMENVPFVVNQFNLLDMLEKWYDAAIEAGIKEEDARYMKPQGTEFKAIIGMNAHALIDWFKIRCCNRAQSEIRDMTRKMLILCKEAAPDLFVDAGPSCVNLGYCPEMEQCDQFKGTIPTKADMNKYIKEVKAQMKAANV